MGVEDADALRATFSSGCFSPHCIGNWSQDIADKEKFCCLDLWVDETCSPSVSRLYVLPWLICLFIKGASCEHFLGFGVFLCLVHAFWIKKDHFCHESRRVST